MFGRKFLFILLFISATGIIWSQNNLAKLLTIAEESNFKSTSRYADVIKFIGQLKKISPYIRTEVIGKSIEGREIPLMILGSPLPKLPRELKNDKRTVVYIQGNIHAGEVEGKEASLMLAREILTKRKDLLKNVVLLICPIFNADGNEKISPNNRRHQNGPENGVGIRYNGQNLDLNRDAMKLETPEVKGLIQNVLNKWDPAVFMDLHTTNGSYHEEPTTFVWQMNPNGDTTLISYMRDKMMPEVSKTLLEKFGILNCFYGEFVDQRDYSKGWISYAFEPRYIVNYVGLRNRLSILNENYVYADFKSRVMGCYNLLWSVLDYTAKNGDEIKKLIAEADRKTVERGLNPTEKDSFAVEFNVKPTKEKVTIHSFELEEYKEKGRTRLRKTDIKKKVTVDYLADYSPKRSVKFPYAYLTTVNDPEVTGLLLAHGIKLEKTTAPLSLEVESFKINEMSPEPRSNQGHYMNKISGEFIKEKKDFSAGIILIRTAQPLANVAAYLLEPETDDGLLIWNYFDHYLVPQWGSGYYPYPVYKVLNKTDIPSTKY